MTQSPRVRNNDYATSIEGAEQVRQRAPNQKYRLLYAFYRAGGLGYTDEQAAKLAGLQSSCYWKRAGELRQDGLIEFTEWTRRSGASGVSRKVSVITDKGRKVIDES